MNIREQECNLAPHTALVSHLVLWLLCGIGSKYFGESLQWRHHLLPESFGTLRKCITMFQHLGVPQIRDDDAANYIQRHMS